MARGEEIIALLANKVQLSSSEIGAELGLSRQALQRYLTHLIQEQRIVRRGNGRATRYSLASVHGLPRVGVRDFPSGPFPEEDRVYAEQVASTTQALPRNVRDVIRYAFTELFNNALEHARAKSIRVVLAGDAGGYAFEIIDDGVGCFENIRATLGLADLRAAAEQLSKGKTTTEPEAHTGEGIFFTSHAVTQFAISANGLEWIVDNLRDDFAISVSETQRGTRVRVHVAADTDHDLEAVFRRFTGEDFRFSRTQIVVRLFERGDAFMSRSEAKRLLAGLDKFEEIILDFDRVRTVGQGFADQVFRVFTREYPHIELTAINTNPAVELMVRRAVAG